MRSSIFTQPSLVNVQLHYKAIVAYNLDIRLTQSSHLPYNISYYGVVY